MKASSLRRGMNFWPPFLFSGIKVIRISADFREVDVELHQRFYNKNYVGTHFGGSIFAMADPFFMVMITRNLSREWTVWDKSAEIEFLKPGIGTLRAKFRVTQEMIEEIIAATLHIRRKIDERKRIGG